MMAARVAVAALFGALVLAGSLAPQTAHRAAACSYPLLTLEQVSESAQIVIAGEVIAERTVDVAPFSHDAYASTIRVAVTFKGRLDHEFTLSPIGFLGSDCSGGPRLEAGEQVLLFLERYGGKLHVVGYEQGKYLLADGEAQVAFQNIPPEPPIPVGEALQTVVDITGASQAELDAALAFARGGPLPEAEPVSQPEPPEPISAQPEAIPDDGGQPALLIALASLGLLAVTGALFALRLRRSRQ